MITTEKLAAWSEELRELHGKLEIATARRAELQSQVRALETQTAILRTREQELTRDIERRSWAPLSPHA